MPRFPTLTTRTDRPLQPGLATLALVCTLVLLFRGAAWLSPSRFIVMPESVVLPLTGLGLLFLACGVWAWLSRPSSLTRVFLAYGVDGAVHWGGSVAVGGEAGGISFLVFYLAATAMSEAALLDLALRYPQASPKAALRTAPLYLLAVIALGTAPVAPFLPRPIIETGIGVAMVGASVMSIAAGVIFLAKWYRATPTARQTHGMTLLAWSLVLATAIDWLADAGALPGEPDAWHLAYGLIPLALARTLARSPATRVEQT